MHLVVTPVSAEVPIAVDEDWGGGRVGWGRTRQEQFTIAPTRDSSFLHEGRQEQVLDPVILSGETWVHDRESVASTGFA